MVRSYMLTSLADVILFKYATLHVQQTHENYYLPFVGQVIELRVVRVSDARWKHPQPSQAPRRVSISDCLSDEPCNNIATNDPRATDECTLSLPPSSVGPRA